MSYSTNYPADHRPSLIIAIVVHLTSFAGISASIIAICTVWLIPALKPSVPPWATKSAPTRPRARSLPNIYTREPCQLDVVKSESTPNLPLPPVEEPPSVCRHATFADPDQLPAVSLPRHRPKLVRKLSMVVSPSRWPMSRTRTSAALDESKPIKSNFKPLLRRLTTSSPLTLSKLHITTCSNVQT